MDECIECDGSGMIECPEMCGADEDCAACGGAEEVECYECDSTGEI